MINLEACLRDHITNKKSSHQTTLNFQKQDILSNILRNNDASAWNLPHVTSPLKSI